jgi:hypothetical protein
MTTSFMRSPKIWEESSQESMPNSTDFSNKKIDFNKKASLDTREAFL